MRMLYVSRPALKLAGFFLPEGEAALAVNVDGGAGYMQDFPDILAGHEIPAT